MFWKYTCMDMGIYAGQYFFTLNGISFSSDYQLSQIWKITLNCMGMVKQSIFNMQSQDRTGIQEKSRFF